MQKTRLNILFDDSLGKFGRFFQNPWRRFALILISLLLGNFAGTVIPTTAGQEAAWDPVLGAGILLMIELVNRIYYGRPKLTNNNLNQEINQGNQLFFDLLNIFKIGLIYGLIVEALELGS